MNPTSRAIYSTNAIRHPLNLFKFNSAVGLFLRIGLSGAVLALIYVYLSSNVVYQHLSIIVSVAVILGLLAIYQKKI